MIENLIEIINSLWLVNVKVENVTEHILKRIIGVRSHVFDNINQLCKNRIRKRMSSDQSATRITV